MATKNRRIPETATDQPAAESPKRVPDRQTIQLSFVLGGQYSIAAYYVNPRSVFRQSWMLPRSGKGRGFLNKLSKGTLRLLWPFTIPGAAASAQRRYCLVGPPGTLTPAAHPMALPAASHSTLTTPPIDTVSTLAPDTAWLYDEVMSYVELNIKNGWATRPRHSHETLQTWPRLRDASRSPREKWSTA